MWYPGKRNVDRLERRVLELQWTFDRTWQRAVEARSSAMQALEIAKRVRADFNSRFAESIDRKYMFDEILECLDDIMEHLQL